MMAARSTSRGRPSVVHYVPGPREGWDSRAVCGRLIDRQAARRPAAVFGDLTVWRTMQSTGLANLCTRCARATDQRFPR